MCNKDTKDMTASELLRWAANGEPYSNGLDDHTWNNPTGKIKALAEAVTGEWPVDLEAFSHIADKIDAELAQARELSLLQGAAIWAKANGWPDFKEGEDFGAWLDRCAIRIPCFEDGEPVHIGDKAEHPYTGETCTIYCINTFDDFYCLGFVEENSASLCDGERVKRPAPEALGADGLPIKVGDKVWSTVSGNEGIVIALNVNGESTAYVEWGDGRWSPDVRCDHLAHTPPDTQERIDEDVRAYMSDYWGCSDVFCNKCPVKIDGLKPSEHYSVDDCHKAKTLDLLRRQRELDARTGGE